MKRPLAAIVVAIAWLAPPSATAARLTRVDVPLAFETNRGQADASVRFVARGRGYTALLRDRDLVLRSDAAPDAVFRIAFSASADASPPRAEGVVAGRSHYFLGQDPQRWVRDVPRHARVRYAERAPGVDLLFHAGAGALEFDVHASPGADPSALRFEFEGAEAVALTADGSLALRHGAEELRIAAPVIQHEAGEPAATARWVLDRDRRAALALAERTPERPVAVDPVIAFGTHLGGRDLDVGQAIAVGADGFVYVAGRTRSPDFPLVGPPGASARAGWTAFVTKLDPTGSEIVYSTYLGGASWLGEFDQMAIAVDAAGQAHVTGDTDAPDFPLANAAFPSFAGGHDAFAVKLSPDGSQLVFSTYLGGSNDEFGRGIAVDPTGFVVIAGITTSANFPVANAVQSSRAGPSDAFLTKLRPFGALVWSTYLGGSGLEFGYDVAVDVDGAAYATGFSSSDDFPVTANALQATRAGGEHDAFVAKVEAGGGALAWSTYLGASGNEEGLGIALDASRAPVVAGWTSSSDFPTAGAPQPAFGGGEADVFAVRLSPDGSSLRWATLLGGSGADWSYDVAVDALGRVHVASTTTSPDFPLADPVQAALAGPIDAAATRFAADGSRIEWSTLLGGSQIENPWAAGFGIATDRRGAAYVVASTNSADFPTRLAAQPALGGGLDAAVVKLAAEPEVNLRLRPAAGGGANGVLQVLNGSAEPAPVELKLWVDRSGPGGVVAIASAPITLPPALAPIEIAIALPASLPFPGSALGARLVDAVTGATRSESVCHTVPCR